MNANNSTTAKILVVTDLVDDAILIRDMLSREFDQVFTSTDPRQAVAEFDRHQPDILILAFNKLEKSEQYYLGLFRLSKTVAQHLHRTVILCNKDEVARVAELCMKDFFDDYILFWPMTYDAPRLLMSVHNAIRDLGSVRIHAPSTEEFAVQIHQLNRDKTQPAPLAKIESAQPLTQEAQQLNNEPMPFIKSAGTSGNKDERKPTTVLVVDDDSFQRNLINTLLKSENYQVLFAPSGEDALNILRKTQPDVILMDVMMPEMDGIETTRRLKAMPQFAKIPVIMVTGNSEGNVVVDSLKAGASNFVVKPFNSATLIDKINHALGIATAAKK
jgi:CheY-like chemotaxis protein